MQGLKCGKPLAVMLAAMSVIAGASAQQKFIVKDLGVLTGGIINIPARINSNGWVTGVTRRSAGQSSAFLHNTSTLVDIGTLPGRVVAAGADINRFNRIIGTAGSGSTAKAFTWTNGTIQEIAPNLFNGVPTEAGAINDPGILVVNDMPNALAWAIFGSQTLPSPGNIYVTAMNNRNRAVGHFFDGLEQHVFQWTIPIAPNTAEDFDEIDVLRTGQDDADTHGVANDITDINVFGDDDYMAVGTVSHVIGSGVGASTNSLGWASPAAGGTQYLTPLAGDNVSQAFGINRSNFIVGSSGKLSTVNGISTIKWRACMWVPDPVLVFRPVDAAMLMPPNTDIVPENLISINDQGQVAGTYTRNGTIRCFRLDPVLSPIAVNLDTTSIAGGLSTQGTVVMDGVAPLGGVSVTMSTNNGIVQVPASVTIPSNSDNRRFNITTSPVTASTPVVIKAERFGYSATNTLRVQPPTLSSIVANPNRVTGGQTGSARITILGLAPANGFSFTLSSSNTNAATMPASGKVPAGASTVDVAVTTKPVTTSVNVTLRATANSITRSTTLNVSTPFLEKLTTNLDSVLGGTLVIGTAHLTANAIVASKVLLSSNAPSVAAVPANITIPVGQKTGTFSINTFATVANVNVTLTGNYNASTKTVVIQVRGPQLRHLILNPTTVLGGEQTSKGSVGLDAAAPAGGITVNLSSTDAGAVPPSTVTVPQGATYRQFTINTNIVESSRTVTILATYLTNTKTAPLVVQGADLIANNLPSPVQPPMGGAYPIIITGQVVLNRPAQAGGAKVFFDTTDPADAIPPFAITIPTGQQFLNYNVQVLRASDFTITATRGAISIPRDVQAL